MLEFVDSGLYFVQDENNFMNPLLQVGFGSVSGSNEKSTGSGSGGPKINVIRPDPDPHPWFLYIPAAAARSWWTIFDRAVTP